MKYPVSEYAKYLLSLEAASPAEQKAALKKLVSQLLKNGDIKEWKRIEDTYIALRDRSAKKKNATVTYWGEVAKTAIQNSLKDYEVNFIEDKRVKGGAEIKIGDIRIQNTVASRLAEVKKALI